MRSVFAKAVARNDFDYLVQRVKDRREVETELRQQSIVIVFAEEAMRRAGIRREHWCSQPRYASAVAELEQIKEEWKSYE